MRGVALGRMGGRKKKANVGAEAVASNEPDQARGRCRLLP